MVLTERLQRVRERREARGLGRRAALGLVDPGEVVALVHPDGWHSASACPVCGGPAAVDLLDLPADRAQLRCGHCDHVWALPLREPRSAHHEDLRGEESSAQQ